MATFRENSKNEWRGNSSIEHINAGSLQRIADAMEKMSVKYTALLDHIEWYKRRLREEQNTNNHLTRSNQSLRGQITKLKKKIEGNNNDTGTN